MLQSEYLHSLKTENDQTRLVKRSSHCLGFKQAHAKRIGQERAFMDILCGFRIIQFSLLFPTVQVSSLQLRR